MHEYDITQNIISVVCEEAKKNNAGCVKSIKLVIGELSSIIDECIYMYFDVLSKDTICSNAKLEFIRVNSKLKCKKCDILFEKNNYLICPDCGSLGSLTDIGKEFYIESIEVE